MDLFAYLQHSWPMLLKLTGEHLALVGSAVGAAPIALVAGLHSFPAALAIVISTFPLGERGKAMAIFFGIAGGLTSVGPIAGGYLTSIDWRAIFWVRARVAPTAMLAWSTNCCGDSPDNAWMFEILITAFAGINACPGATTLFKRSMPIKRPGENGQATLLAMICASVRLVETHRPPGNRAALIAAGAIVGTPKKPRGYENGWTARWSAPPKEGTARASPRRN